ncbi:hypothetical protein ACQUW5_04465 [Legionella sp. CNM-1927-20]|uniref:hypothetical protein n=1 Tax=Legionella sp. CNM-1927-20 TaxID=3422221 RepID=UPI00403A9221
MQVIGYLQRSLPAIDRFALANDIKKLVKYNLPIEHSSRIYYYGKEEFPVVVNDNDSASGLGFTYGIGVGGSKRQLEWITEVPKLKQYFEKKQEHLQSLYPEKQPSLTPGG